MDYLKSNVNFVREYLKNNIPKIKLVEPEATYLLWLDCRELEISTEKLNKIFIDSAKVALNKGTTFGKEGEGYMRLNIGCSKSVLLEGLSKIKHAIKK